MTEIDLIWWTNRSDVQPYDQWDSHFLRRTLGYAERRITDRIWETQGRGLDLGHDIGIFVVAAGSHAAPEHVAALNEDLARYDRAMICLIGDEGSDFPWREISHEWRRMWVQSPHPIKHSDLVGDATFFGFGVPDRFLAEQPVAPPAKDVDWAFAGQVTHSRRKQLASGIAKLRGRRAGLYAPTEAFSDGLSAAEYASVMRRTRIAFAPSGPLTPDSFRFYEALQVGAWPIVDPGPKDYPDGYWQMLHPDMPVHRVHNWESDIGVADQAGRAYPLVANLSSAWWKQQQLAYGQMMVSDLAVLGANVTEEDLSIVITTSPAASNPDTSMLEETFRSAWQTLGFRPTTYIAFDGVRQQQSGMKADYDEYVRRAVWRSLNDPTWREVVPWVSSAHLHQAKLTRAVMDTVKTPVVLMMEHDTPMVTDEPIDWDASISLMKHGHLDVLRFHHESYVLDVHSHLMIDAKTVEMAGVPVRRTRQWSQRPHLARVDYYKRILADNFNTPNNGFIEDRMHSIAQTQPPSRNRIAIYHPPGGNIKRSLHTDGRQGGKKYDEVML